IFFFSSRRRHTIFSRDWSSDVCSSDLLDETKLSYERKLVVTQRWFLGSAIFLLICVLPIVGQLIPGPWQQWFPSTPHNGEGASEIGRASCRERVQIWLGALALRKE